ncbi:Uma2 family endonuclease [Actinoplanes sp. NPDC049596]|uniref:Uma2 family endonuclease n=1 Tax=unclassified Actinoplanes TaxID=2626549 RepID=UPI00343B5C79
MTEAFFDHPEPWTEAEYLALGETSSRIELVDGGLRVSPAGNIAHQAISDNLHTVLQPAAQSAHMRVVSAINVHLSPGRILIPDLAVGTMPRVGVLADAATVEMVVEILSPSSVTMDRTEKRELYAAAKIDWYLLVEPDMPDYEGVTLRLLRRRNGGYDEVAVAKHGETLRHDRPFPIEVNTDALLDF